VTASNGAGVTETQAVVFTIADTNRLPVVGPQAFQVGQSVSLSEQGTDNTGTNVLSYSVSGLPDGLDIGSSSGVISGTVAADAAAPGSVAAYTPTITLTDNHGGTDSRVLSLAVGAPVLSWATLSPDTPSLTNPGKPATRAISQ
jgi:hypothetical protein